MFEKPERKEAHLQIRVTAREKKLIKLMAARSSKGDVSNWLMMLVHDELTRVKEFDEEIQKFIQQNE